MFSVGNGSEIGMSWFVYLLSQCIGHAVNVMS